MNDNQYNLPLVDADGKPMETTLVAGQPAEAREKYIHRITPEGSSIRKGVVMGMHPGLVYQVLVPQASEAYDHIRTGYFAAGDILIMNIGTEEQYEDVTIEVIAVLHDDRDHVPVGLALVRT